MGVEACDHALRTNCLTGRAFKADRIQVERVGMGPMNSLIGADVISCTRRKTERRRQCRRPLL